MTTRDSDRGDNDESNLYRGGRDVHARCLRQAVRLLDR